MANVTSSAGEENPRTPFRQWPTFARVPVFILIGLLVAALIAGLSAVAAVRASFPQTSGRIELAGLQAEVEILRSADGIPQVYADTSDDLFFGQGYVHAQDRFWQMDWRRHVAAGRTAEIVGEAGVRADLIARTLGWYRDARAELRLLSESSREALRAYAAGVNAWLSDRSDLGASFEYVVFSGRGLDLDPGEWTEVDSLAWLKADAWAQVDFSDEIEWSRVAALYSPAVADSLLPPLRPMAEAWAVAGSHTASGEPILAANPRGTPELPGQWYQVGLHCREVSQACPYDVSGLSQAGVPGVMMGRTANMAWALTPQNADHTDLFLESIEGREYRRGKQTVPLEHQNETVVVRGERDRRLTIRTTVHGPLLSDVSPQLSTVGANAPVPNGSPARGNGYAVAVASPALGPNRAMDALLQLARAIDARDVLAVGRRQALAGRSVVYAQRRGTIGLVPAGALPDRPAGHIPGRPVPGWLPKHDWRGWLAPSAADVRVNPASGSIGVQLDGPATADTIARRLTDTTSPIAAALVPLLVRLAPDRGYYAQGPRLLEEWDFTQSADSAAAAFFNVVLRSVLDKTLSDDLRRQPDGNRRWTTVLRNLLSTPRSPWWDDRRTEDVVETRDDILAAALTDARNDITRLHARDAADWRWGELHELDLENPAGRTGWAGKLLDRKFPGVGGPGAVVGTDWHGNQPYRVGESPTARFVIDLGEASESRWVVLGGASGHAFSRHYKDQMEPWLAGAWLDWPDDEVEGEGLTLAPKSAPVDGR